MYKRMEKIEDLRKQLVTAINDHGRESKEADAARKEWNAAREAYNISMSAKGSTGGGRKSRKSRKSRRQTRRRRTLRK